jgi:hypothetical protein
MPKDGVGKVSGNHKEKDGRRSAAGVPNPLAAIRSPFLIPLTGSGAEKRGASHTHTQDLGFKKNAKGASNTQGQGTIAAKKGTRHTQAEEEAKGEKTKKASASSLSADADRNLENEKLKAQAAEEQAKKSMSYLARKLSSMGGPLLSDTLDANHLACYLALEAEKNSLAPKLYKGDCVFTVIEIWQQSVEMVRQSGG